MSAFIDLTGQTFGLLTVLDRAGTQRYPGGGSQRMWLCRCECGELRTVSGSNLKRGQSCGSCQPRWRLYPEGCQHPEGCPRPHHAGGWCDVHWMRIKRQGAPGKVELQKFGPTNSCELAGRECNGPHGKAPLPECCSFYREERSDRRRIWRLTTAKGMTYYARDTLRKAGRL